MFLTLMILGNRVRRDFGKVSRACRTFPKPHSAEAPEPRRLSARRASDSSRLVAGVRLAPFNRRLSMQSGAERERER